jgi:DGQHR domain-containing protein
MLATPSEPPTQVLQKLDSTGGKAIRRSHEAPAPISIRVTPGPTLKRKRRTVVGAIAAQAIVDRYIIPYRNHAQKTGYQREASTTRINQLVREMTEKRVDLPTAILVNIRDIDASEKLRSSGDALELVLASEPIYIVDGQHRVLALDRLVTADSERWGSFLIPFVCMLGADARDEMEQFYIVNSTAKSVRTDLALDLLKQRAESDTSTMSALVERNQEWKVKAQTITDELAKTPMWLAKIRFPGDPSGATTLASSGFVSSLRKLLSTPYFGSITTDNQVKLLNAYWQGVNKCLPEAFLEPSKFALQKTIGTTVMHAVLVPILEHLRSNGMSLVDPDSYVAALQASLDNLEGETATGEIVRGIDFWRSGTDGAAGSYSSSAGQRVLISKVTGLLPEVEVA